MANDRRGTIVVEDATVLMHKAYAGDQYYLRLQAPEIAKRALPGSFLHLHCDRALPMRRPMSIMRCSGEVGWVDILYKAHGVGTKKLTERKQDEVISCIGPIGVPFKLAGYKTRPLLLGGGVGIPPMIFLAEHMRSDKALMPLVLMGSEVPFPFSARPSQILTPLLPPDVIAAMPLLDDWNIASRLASLQGYAGTFNGYVTDLARRWLDAMTQDDRSNVEIFACGPTPMLRAVASLAKDYALPCQVSLEEFMACAVGGCAGCAVQLRTPEGPVMKRVCVDGPVFDASTVVFQ